MTVGEWSRIHGATAYWKELWREFGHAQEVSRAKTFEVQRWHGRWLRWSIMKLGMRGESVVIDIQDSSQ